MPQHTSGDRDKTQSRQDSQATSREPVGDSITSLEKGGEAQKVESVADYYYGPPEGPFWKFVWKYSQVILSVLTFGILVYYAVQWSEFRSSRVVENRAYVVSSFAGFEPDATNANIQFLYVYAVNSGRTPALNGDIKFILERRQTSPPDDTVVNPPDQVPTRMVFGAGLPIKKLVGQQEQPSKGPQAVPTEGIRKTIPTPTPTPMPTPVPTTTQTQDTRPWYVYGTITYDDIFGVRRQTKFCYTTTVGTSTWWFCPTFNDAN